MLPLSEPKLREAGLRLPAQSARLAVGVLRFLEPTEQPEHVALTVVREPRHHAQRIEARARESCRFECVVPGAVELQELGAMDEAAAREGDEIRLPHCPRGQRSRPLPRATHLEHPLAGENDAAIDETFDKGRHLSRGHRDHRLVEQHEALVHAARLHEHLALAVKRQSE